MLIAGRELEIYSNADALAIAAANLIQTAATQAIAERGRFTIALTGGSTPEQTYLRLADPAVRESIDWSRWYIFIGDERFVPSSDPRSNLSMVTRTLLSRVQIPYGHVFPIDTHAPTPQDSAEDYSKRIKGFFGVAEKSPPPALDLILLGVGDDGHVASLFPGNPSLSATAAWFTSSPPGTLPPPVDRVTATLPFINAARQVLFLVSGTKKAAIVEEIFQNPQAAAQYPAAMIRPEKGALNWLLDKDAAANIAPPPSPPAAAPQP